MVVGVGVAVQGFEHRESLVELVCLGAPGSVECGASARVELSGDGAQEQAADDDRGDGGGVVVHGWCLFAVPDRMIQVLTCRGGSTGGVRSV